MKQNRIKTLLFLCLGLFFFSTNHTKAQTILLDPPEIYLGVSGGATGSMMFFNPKVQQTYLLGYNGGFAFRYVTEKHFGLQLELNYSQCGWSEVNKLYTRQLNYIEMPFLSHFYLGKGSRFIFNLGPKFSYLLSEKTIEDNTFNSTQEQHIKPAYFKFDYGVAAGLGYNLKTQNAGLYQFEVRAYYGLGDVFANTKSDYFNTSNHLNISVNLAYFFQLTGR